MEGPAKVAGLIKYTANVDRPGVVCGKVLRSTLPHARILNVDTSKAQNLPGVKAVITGRDVSPRLVGASLKDMPVLARDRVRFVGEEVAGVAAVDLDTAEEGIALIQVEYEELPAVFDPLEAMKPDAPLIHPDYASYEGPRTKAPYLRNVQTLVQQGDQGVGAYTMHRQIVSQIIGIDPERVDIEIGNTNSAPYDEGIKGARGADWRRLRGSIRKVLSSHHFG